MSQLVTISANQLAKLNGQESLDLIDVRSPAEFQELHVSFARNVPLETLKPGQVIEQRTSHDAPLYLICKGGTRGAKACQKFVEQGYQNVINVEGGTEACEKAGLPVTRGRRTMSLERQVRITAGLLVLIGAILAILVHPYYAIISGFVGAGLAHSGITDSSLMGMLMARMPWNQVKSETNHSV